MVLSVPGFLFADFGVLFIVAFLTLLSFIQYKVRIVPITFKIITSIQTNQPWSTKLHTQLELFFKLITTVVGPKIKYVTLKELHLFINNGIQIVDLCEHSAAYVFFS